MTGMRSSVEQSDQAPRHVETPRNRGAPTLMTGIVPGIEPFCGLLVRQQHAGDVVAPAFDALTSEQRKAFRATHPHSYLQVTRSAQDEPDAATVDNTTLALRGRDALETMIAADLFMPAGEPAFFVYRLVEGAHAQAGLVCEVPADYAARVARPHEATQPDRAALLAEHFRVVGASSSPVACAVRDDGGLERELDAATTSAPVLDMRGDDGVQQTVWRVDDAAATQRLRGRLQDQPLFIIDGHHRSAAIQQLRADGMSLPVLTAVFPEQSLRLVGFHRLLKLHAPLTPADLLGSLRRRFRVEATGPVDSVAPGRIALVVGDQWHLVHFDERPVSGGPRIRLGSLDPVVVEREILQAIVGSVQPVDIAYTPDTRPFPVIVGQARAQGRIPIFVAPVAIADMMAVAEGGEIMPAKSTYFTPKVRSGIFVRPFDELEPQT